ncbi:hypothetical protein [Chromohalobacter israelensis]|uniref:hypothetical protein n=1 Tax=Chromohalobacter israelensis TaxID=141390 RepID=UPI001F0BF4C3|nr:hypothetical protein [Chromohalobacter salexigens]
MAEILYGIERLPSGKRHRRCAAMAAAMFEEDFVGHILPFDEVAAVHYAEQLAISGRAGRVIIRKAGRVVSVEADVATKTMIRMQVLNMTANFNNKCHSPWSIPLPSS